MDKRALRLKERESLSIKLRNPNLNDCTEALLGIVKDKKQNTIFYDYEPKGKIGRNIYAELLEKYIDDKGFKLSDEMEEVGILSQTQGACTLDVLIGNYGVISNLSKQDASQLKEIYERTIRDILARVYMGKGEYIFSATPYNINIFKSGCAYVDAMTWTSSAFLGAIALNGKEYQYLNAREGRVKIAFTKDEIAMMLDVLSYCIRFFLTNYIDISDKYTDCLSKGWNFTGGCSEPSLYFTFAVSEFYLDVYNSFQQVIDHHNIGMKIDKVKNDNHLQMDDVWLYISSDDRINYESININSDNYVRQENYFDIINGSDGCFYAFEQLVKNAAYNIWALTKKGIDSHFYNYNLSSYVEPQSIESSSSSDALFNTIFVINCIITGGVDEDLLDKVFRTDDEDEMNRFQAEYDNLMETLQAALQRAIRYNKTLRAKKKDYIVNDFIISCSETFEGEVGRKAQELRKKRIKTFTLSPLLVKTNNLISEYLTKYPQVEMVKYLDELLMKKRTVEEAVSEEGDTFSFYTWIWENGEYLITSNYYYILSLVSFYEYEEKYESRFSVIDRNNAKIKELIIAKHDQESWKNGELFKLSHEKEALQHLNGELVDKITDLESKESIIEKSLRAFLRQEIKEESLTLMTSLFHDLNQALLTNLNDSSFVSLCEKELSFMEEFKRTLSLVFLAQMKKRLKYSDIQEANTPFALSESFLNRVDAYAEALMKDILEDTNFLTKFKGDDNV